MHIFKTIKKNNQTRYKIFGITYSWKVSNEHYSKYKKEYFNGIIKILRKFDSKNYQSEHNIWITDFHIKIEEKDELKSYYINNCLLYSIPIKQILKKRYFNRINKKHDHVYILNANSGETYLFLRYALDALIKKDNAKKPILIATKKYHIEMIKMICPDIPYIFIRYVYANLKDTVFEIDKMKFSKIFPWEHFSKVEELLRHGDKNAHYFYSILDTLSIPSEEIVPRAVVSLAKSKNSMLKKIKQIGLNTDNFIFISPEANSCELLDNSFWVNLIKKLQAEDYDIFVNIMGDDLDLSEAEYKTCNLSYSEAFELVKMAKKVYSLRSGFTEFLLETHVPMEVYYTKFRNNDINAELIKSGFSMLRIPGVNPTQMNEIVIK